MSVQTVAINQDRLLAERVLTTGDEAAFRELYRAHTPRLYSFVLRILAGDERDAEDAVQETWIRAVEALGRFRWEARFGTWLTGIGLNVCRNQIRRSSRRREVGENAAPAPARKRPDDERIDLERALGLLPPGQREVVVLHDVEGWKHREIAERLGVTEGTSKSQLFAGRRALRALLADTDSGMEG